MANVNKEFKKYNSIIRLTNSRRKSLKTSRKELRKKIRKWFKENKPNETKPKFSGQGSMDMNTIINPLPRKEEINGQEKTLLNYDIDDGIYFIGNTAAEDRPSPSTYHQWIVDAAKGHTEIYPIDKNACVRTIFADGHNIDHPIYYKMGDIPELAHKIKGWLESDPKAFSDWFNDKAKEEPQLRRLVRYGKSWLDFLDFQDSSKLLPSGLVITILFTENAVYRKDRDDIALKETLVNIQAVLQRNFACYRPTIPKGEDLLADYSNKDYFMKCLADFITDAKEALRERNFKDSTLLWRKHLSDRFPLGEDKLDDSSSSGGLGAIIPPTTKPYCE